MTSPLALFVAQIAAIPEHNSGCLNGDVLWALANYAPADLKLSAETGCGRSTILLSHLMAGPDSRHFVFAFDDRVVPNGSIWQVTKSPLTDLSRVEFVFGPTQQTLVNFDFTAAKAKYQPEGFDLVIIDGPHGWPFVELEYYRFYPHIRPGGILMVDDLHIPTIRRFFDILREDDNYVLLDIVSHTAFFRRTDVPCLDPLGDDWPRSGYNIKQFPHSVPAIYAPLPPTKTIDFKAADSAVYVNGGFSHPGDQGIWTITQTASLMFAAKLQGGDRVEIDIAANHVTEPLTITMNNQPVDVDMPIGFTGTCRLSIPAEAINTAGRLLIAIDLPGVRSPHQDNPHNYDINKYGLLISSLRITQ